MSSTSQSCPPFLSIGRCRVRRTLTPTEQKSWREPSALPSEPLNLQDVLVSVADLRASCPPRPSATDKREANHATTLATSQLSRIETTLVDLSSSLASPSKETLLAAERTFGELLTVFGSIRRSTPSLDQRRRSISEKLGRVQARIYELRNLYPKDAESEPTLSDASNHYAVPADQYHVVAQVAMFLGIVLHVLGKLGRAASDFLLCSLSLLVGVSFEVSSSSSSLTAEQEGILSQIPCTLKAALERFNLSAKTTTYASCSECHFVYDPVVDVHTGGVTYPKRCTNTPEVGGRQCGALLLDETEARPKRPYVVHDFDDYVSGVLSSEINVRIYKALRERISAALKRNIPVDEVSDSYDAEFIRSFTFTQDGKCTFFVDDQTEYRLPFAFHVDSFNIEGLRLRGASSSSTVISMAPLWLPVELRHKAENMYLAAIIPGPREPSLEALNYYLRPIMDSLVISWKRGVYHSRVATEPHGCVSRSAVVAAVMDLVAARKTSQLASHSAHIYCTVCTCSGLDTRGRTDYTNWKPRDPAEMRKQAEAWRDAASKSDREKLFHLHGVRWSELWRLPYWDPTRQLVVDSMHCIFEGLVPYHFRELLGLTAVNANAKDDLQPAFVHPFVAVDVEANSELDSKDERKMSDKAIKDVRLIQRSLCLPIEGDVEAGLKKLHKDLGGRNLKALRFVGTGLCIPQVKPKMIRKDWADCLVEWRRRKPVCSDQAPAEKLATPEVIARIQEVIQDAVTPSWLSSVPKNFGEARAGTLKADEWRILCTVYFPLALVSLWGSGAVYGANRDAAFLLRVLNNTMMLVSAVIVLCKRTTTIRRSQKYREYLAKWLNGVQELHPEGYSHRTNNHMAFHIYDFLRLFGPVYSWWCFPFERLIGHLQRLPHNDKSGEAELTMLNSYLRAAKLRRWFQRPDCPPALRQVKRFFDKAFGTGNFARSEEILELSEENVDIPRHRSPIPEDLKQLLTCDERKRAVLSARCKHDGVVFARSATHLGNSLIRYYGSDRTKQYGCIKYIYKIGKDVRFVVQRHLPARGEDPFKSYADFLATVKSPELSPHLECISLEHVICHFARWRMPSGDVAVLPLYK
ncbi:hypothetical protein TRAPUB_2364, partial [Trametes pubescens]